MFKRFLILALVLGLSSMCFGGVECPPAAGDYTIMLISDSGMERDGVLDADGYTKAQGGKYVDETLVIFLENLGYTVNTFGMGGRYRRQGKDQYGYTDDWWENLDDRYAPIHESCMVIVSKFASSGSYARNENPCDTTPGYDSTTEAWNRLPVPLLSQNAHLIRGSGTTVPGLPKSTKWGWNDAGNGRQFQGCLATEMAPLPKKHPAYSWTFCMRKNLFDYTTNEGNGAKDTRGISDGREPDLCVGAWPTDQWSQGY
jgi:hypothetical protein